MALNKSMTTGAAIAGAACFASIGGALSASAAAYADEGPAAQPVTALHCGHLIDTAAGTVLGATTIVIEGKRVRAVSGSAAVPGATEIDLHDQTSATQFVDQFHWNIADLYR
jgi:hypothetical protein